MMRRRIGTVLLLLVFLYVLAWLGLGWGLRFNPAIQGLDSGRVMVPAAAFSFLIVLGALFFALIGRRGMSVLLTLAMTVVVASVAGLQALGFKDAAGFFVFPLAPGQCLSPATATGFALMAITLFVLSTEQHWGTFRHVALVTLGLSVSGSTAVLVWMSGPQTGLPFFDGTSNATATVQLIIFAVIALLFFREFALLEQLPETERDLRSAADEDLTRSS